MSGSDLHIIPMLAASGVEFLVILVIMAASAIFNWLQKRKQGDEDEWSGLDKPSQPPSPTSTSRKTTNWEEELRRMLEGETPAAPPAAPPVIREQRTPPPLPRTTPAPLAPPVRTVKTYRAHCEHCDGHIEFPSDLMGTDIRCPHCYQQTRLNPYGDTAVERRAHRPELSPVLPSHTAVAPTHAQHALAARFAETAPRSSQAAKVQRRQISGEVREVVSLFRNPRTARQAVIASIILNPPKSTEL